MAQAGMSSSTGPWSIVRRGESTGDGARIGSFYLVGKGSLTIPRYVR